MIDLHTHSSASDGTDSPTELVRLAADAGLSAVALTDHDTIAGIGEAMAAGNTYGIRVIPGIELSAAPPVSDGELHLLGYFFRPDDPALLRFLSEMKTGRDRRAPMLAEKLASLGIDVTDADARWEAEEAAIPSRVHFARAMVRKGYVSSVADAFARYLGKGCPAYTARPLPSAEEAIRVIREAGGIVSAAHLHHLHLDDASLRTYLFSLAQAGLAAVEGYYPEYTPEMAASFREAARDAGLHLSGGSDYHGSTKPQISLGMPGVPDDLLLPLAALRQK